MTIHRCVPLLLRLNDRRVSDNEAPKPVSKGNKHMGVLLLRNVLPKIARYFPKYHPATVDRHRQIQRGNTTSIRKSDRKADVVPASLSRKSFLNMAMTYKEWK